MITIRTGANGIESATSPEVKRGRRVRGKRIGTFRRLRDQPEPCDKGKGILRLVCSGSRIRANIESDMIGVLIILLIGIVSLMYTYLLARSNDRRKRK